MAKKLQRTAARGSLGVYWVLSAQEGPSKKKKKKEPTELSTAQA